MAYAAGLQACTKHSYVCVMCILILSFRLDRKCTSDVQRQHQLVLITEITGMRDCEYFHMNNLQFLKTCACSVFYLNHIVNNAVYMCFHFCCSYCLHILNQR